MYRWEKCLKVWNDYVFLHVSAHISLQYACIFIVQVRFCENVFFSMESKWDPIYFFFVPKGPLRSIWIDFSWPLKLWENLGKKERFATKFATHAALLCCLCNWIMSYDNSIKSYAQINNADETAFLTESQICFRVAQALKWRVLYSLVLMTPQCKFTHFSSWKLKTLTPTTHQPLNVNSSVLSESVHK